MHEFSLKNQVYSGANGRASLYDISIPKNWNNTMVLFLHGYMGYKDWGAWNLMETFFLENQYGFVKFNVSHNGGTISNPIDFDDLDAFSCNNYAKELEDFEAIVEEIRRLTSDQISIYLIGHSRGGGMALLQSDHPNVKKIATLAAISSIENRFPKGEELSNWEKTDLWYRLNGRTKQEMPHRYKQYTNYLQNRERLNIQHYAKNANVPLCIIHGTDDPAVLISEGRNIAQWSNTEIIEISGEQHTFGASQPWKEKTLPLGLSKACNEILSFFNS